MCHETIRNGFRFNSRWQNRKERPNRPTNNLDMTETAKRPMTESVCDIYLIREKMSF